MRPRSASRYGWCAPAWACGAWLGLAIASPMAGCHSRYAADEPVKMAPEGCCKLADEGMKKFAGCRMTHRCRDDEPIWIRGAVNCSPVDEANCAGGRCCELQPLYGSPDGVLNWDKTMKKSDSKSGTTPDAKAPPADATATPPAASDATTPAASTEPDVSAPPP